MNYLGLLAVALSIVTFALVYRQLRARSTSVRLLTLSVLALLAVPSILFAIYYLHILPEHAWFYTFHSWRGTEFLVLFLGGAGGALATLLPRFLLAFPLAAVIGLGIIPHLKPLLGPLPESAFRERWKGATCLQSTPSTCGAASVATILRHLGVTTTEQAVARAAFSYTGGTEAWYLARYVRSRGLAAHFSFQPSFAPEVGLPALVGVRFGALGHFIAVLGVKDGQVSFADPLSGPAQLPLEQFQQRYQFTGFHMVVAPGSS